MRALRAGWFDGWLRVLFVLFLLLAWFLLSPAAIRWRPDFVFVSTSLLPALNDLLVRTLVPAGLLAQRWESPGGLRVIALDLALSSAVRMIHRIHGHAAHGGLDAPPPGASGLAERFILMVKVANLANRGHAVDGKLAHFAAGHLHQREVPFLAEQLRRATRGTHGLPAASRVQLKVVHHRAGRNVANLQSIARKNVRALAGLHGGANFEPHRMDDVTLLAIGIMQQRDVGAAIRIVFDGGNLCRHTDFVAPEVHLAVLLLVTAAAMPDHDFAVIVAAAGALFRLEQGLFRLLLGDMAFVQDGDKPPRRRIWIKAFKCHRCLLPSYFFPAPPCHPERSAVSASRMLLRDEGFQRKISPALTDSPRTQSSFRLPPASRRLSSSRDDSLRSARGGASCRENSRCARPRLSL